MKESDKNLYKIVKGNPLTSKLLVTLVNDVQLFANALPTYVKSFFAEYICESYFTAFAIVLRMALLHKVGLASSRIKSIRLYNADKSKYSKYYSISLHFVKKTKVGNMLDDVINERGGVK